MKKIFRPAFSLVLSVVFIAGVLVAVAPEADALPSLGCPPCYVPSGVGGWTLYGSCDDYSDPHCPLLYRLYRNDYTGQMCRGQFPIANI